MVQSIKLENIFFFDFNYFLVQQPISTILDCVQVDWPTLLKIHTTVKTKQNLAKSFTNWKFFKISDNPELWFCDQVDNHGRSLFRPDNPQVSIEKFIFSHILIYSLLN